MSDAVREHGGAKLAKKRWQPKKWDPIYDQMVAMSCTGMSGKAIGDRFGYTPQQVSNILCSDRGKLIKQMVSQHIVEEMKKDLAQNQAIAERRAHDIIHSVLGNNDLLASNPLAMYDRAIKFLEGRGQLEDPTKKQQSTAPVIVMGDELANKLISGINKANEAIALHNGVEVMQLMPGVQNGPNRKSA
jgi:hypothetical protein